MKSTWVILAMLCFSTSALCQSDIETDFELTENALFCYAFIQSDLSFSILDVDRERGKSATNNILGYLRATYSKSDVDKILARSMAGGTLKLKTIKEGMAKDSQVSTEPVLNACRSFINTVLPCDSPSRFQKCLAD